MARFRTMRFRGRPGGSGAMTHFLGTGGMADDGFVYRARTDQAATLQLDYSTNSDLSSSTRSAGVTTSIDDDFTGGETITGLSANTTYYIAPVVNGSRQGSAPWPQTKTAPTAGQDASFTFVAVSCQKRATDAVTGAWAAAAAETPAFQLHLGDFVYGDHNTLATIREAYREEYSGDQQTYVTNVMPRAQTKDDHDSAGNNSNGDTTGIALTRQGWKEYVPSYPLWDPDHHIGYSFTYANCEFFVVDTREQREGSRPRYPSTANTYADAQTGTNETQIVFPGDAPGNAMFYVKAHDGGGTDIQYRRVETWNNTAKTATLDRAITGMTAGWKVAAKFASMLDMDKLTDGQVDRLCDGLVNSTKRWKFFVTSVPWQKRGGAVSGSSDMWAGWDAEWFEKLYIKQRVGSTPNVIVISGGEHMSAIEDGAADSDWPEVETSAFHRNTVEPVQAWSEGAYDNGPSYVTIHVATTPAHTVTITVKDNTGADATGVDPLVVSDAS